jgi:hypothetical protein
MHRIKRALGGFTIVAALAAAGAARADITVRIDGTDANGERMRGNCDLRPLSPPSNTFLGRCELAVGGERLAVAGLNVDGRPVLSAVLDGRITIRGLVESASGKLLPLVSDGAAGFPVFLRIDPFGRAWALERDVPGGGRVAVTGGAISEGRVELGIQ